MKHRKLRIAWSVAWGIVAALVIALWVRSHYSVNQMFLTTPRSAFITIASAPDAILIGMSDYSPTGTWATPTSSWLCRSWANSRALA